ncbi:VRR-NUC domain protein [Kalmanozyma brasiliensis GHG001]|uniref:VRR-NUC domain protein n=1 Tax=Kalmanozyma brasiliensis (strain GHG001) TaxID=1365824 RepID=UPI002867CF45|nr:VRR-NUC domain protein [Kalmanozyma brasiliensis GHG001]EST04970.2 VRR-NUC domain protein [Kalmanozyma brasiliensis GHG001]
MSIRGVDDAEAAITPKVTAQEADSADSMPDFEVTGSSSLPQKAYTNTYRPGSRSSMYPELFQEMLCNVLESESYLFSNAELDLLSAFFMLPYPARYLFVRLLQRKKVTWYRLDRLEAYRAEVQDLKEATEQLATPVSSPPTEGPKVEVARMEEEDRRKIALDTDKENAVLTLPSLQRELKLDEETGLPLKPTYRHKQPLAESSIPANGAIQNAIKPKSSTQEASLHRFVMTERDMKGGIAESLSLLTIEELKVIAKNMGIAKIGTTRAQIVAALSATKSQSMLFRSPTKPTSRPLSGNTTASTKQQQLTLNFTGASKAGQPQASRLKDELSAALGGGCVQVLPAVRSLVDRVALVYYRGNLLGSAALTTAILSRSRIRNYPNYTYRRTSFLFPSRDHLIAFERALSIEAEMEYLIQFGKSEADFQTALDLFESVWAEWKSCVQECVLAHPEGIDKMVYHRMRFHPGWVLTRVVYKGATVLARFKLREREKEVLQALLDQRVFRRGRRGDWYDRLALITALYSDDQRKGKKEALSISVQGMQDPDTHLIYHDTLQRRIARLESQLRVPRSEQHDFSYTKLKKTSEVHFKSVRLDAMVETDTRTNEPITALSRFLQAGDSPPTSPDEPRSKGGRSSPGSRSGSSSPTKGSPVKRSSSGFEIRKPLFKRVKIESFADSAAVKGDPDSPFILSPKAESPGNVVDQARLTPVSDTSSDQIPIKKEDLDDISWDDITAPAPDPTALSILSNGESPTSVAHSTRRSMRSVWRGLDNAPVHVEQLCLQHYALQNFKGYHCEGKLLTMIFVMVMWDIIFLPDIAGSFETPYQSAPLDLGSDSFPIVRSAQIRERLDYVSRTGGLDLIEQVDDRERPNKTWAVGCRWDLFSKQDLLEVAECLGGHSISVVCQMLCEEWDHCSSGMPDLVIWRMEDKVVRFVEVKGPGDRLSETQKVWIDILLRAGIEVQVGIVSE